MLDYVNLTQWASCKTCDWRIKLLLELEHLCAKGIAGRLRASVHLLALPHVCKSFPEIPADPYTIAWVMCAFSPKYDPLTLFLLLSPFLQLFSASQMLHI